jgi:membrane fusion protein, heavy metal efflux system
VENPARLLKKQMYVRVSIHAHQESTGILIPNSAILRDDENLPFVYEARSDGSFARQPVTLGYHAGDQVEIATGLAAGNQIVIEGSIFVQFIQSQ